MVVTVASTVGSKVVIVVVGSSVVVVVSKVVVVVVGASVVIVGSKVVAVVGNSPVVVVDSWKYHTKFEQKLNDSFSLTNIWKGFKSPVDFYLTCIVDFKVVAVVAVSSTVLVVVVDSWKVHTQSEWNQLIIFQ